MLWILDLAKTHHGTSYDNLFSYNILFGTYIYKHPLWDCVLDKLSGKDITVFVISRLWAEEDCDFAISYFEIIRNLEKRN